ncbi:hypothetical protein GCM10011297_08320 [Bacterioplanes sanyensis]|uniref:hypothetical protein n=1 Tax=Bacterioplanes sanyensis TaxID=1249553 RepID=UPI00167C1BBA|nr:hypothetical protein [Bacterioplanes sanyensis]GGY37505.1 hypothetical protein GCM10011297_08320 [Bacterioplanes sanyensis]
MRHYLILLRTFWLGGLWSCAYVVRPLLEHKGYFPHHGVEVMNAMVGIGAVAGTLLLLMALVRRVFDWRQLPSRMLLIMLALSAGYFALLPWWKLQMMVLHAMCVLGLVWLWLAPLDVVRRQPSSHRVD